MTTDWTWLSSTYFKNAENGSGASVLPAKAVENCQIRTPTTTRTIQNNKLLRVEFNLGLLTALLSRVSRLARAPCPENPRPPTPRRPTRSDPRRRRQVAANPWF